MEEQIIEIIRNTLRLPKDQVITADTNIIEELDGDSLDVIEIVIDIEFMFVFPLHGSFKLHYLGTSNY